MEPFSTIGLGDVVPKDPRFVCFLLPSSVIGLALMSMLLRKICVRIRSVRFFHKTRKDCIGPCTEYARYLHFDEGVFSSTRA